MLPPQTLKEHAITFLNLLCNEKDIMKATSYISKDISITHDDGEPVQGSENVLAVWARVLLMPNFGMEITDAVVDGNKVWVFSTITGLSGGTVKHSIDMMEWDDENRLVKCRDVQRVIGQ